MNKSIAILIAAMSIMQCTASVRWSAWLGGEYLVKSILLGCAGLCFAVALAIEIHIIRQICREKKEAKRKQCENPSNAVQSLGKVDKCFGLGFHSLTGNLSALGKCDLKFGNKLSPEMWVVGVFNRLYEVRDAFLNCQCVKGVLKFFRHKRGVTQPPNDPSSAMPERKDNETR